MSKTIAYVRVSTVAQDVQNQKLEILEYARKNDLRVDDFLEIEISSRKTQKERRIEELLSRLSTGDTLIVSELSRLGRSTTEVIDLVNGLVAWGFRQLIEGGRRHNQDGPRPLLFMARSRVQ
jgi:DNA invertase Pin-like site-specific DNA recombinase